MTVWFKGVLPVPQPDVSWAAVIMLYYVSILIEGDGSNY